MPRKGPATRRELVPDPVFRSVLVTQVVNKVLSRGKRTLAERLVYDALDVVAREDRRRPGHDPQAGRGEHEARARGEEPSGRWRHVPGAGRGPSPAGDDARHPVAGGVLPSAPREDDGRATGERGPRRRQRPSVPRSSAGRTCTRWPNPTRPSPTTAGSGQGARRAPPRQPGPSPNNLKAQHHGRRTPHSRVPPRPDPQHRDHGPHRRGQDHDDRADPLLHRQELQDR